MEYIMKIAENILELIGNTPIVKINKLSLSKRQPVIGLPLFYHSYKYKMGQTLRSCHFLDRTINCSFFGLKISLNVVSCFCAKTRHNLQCGRSLPSSY